MQSSNGVCDGSARCPTAIPDAVKVISGDSVTALVLSDDVSGVGGLVTLSILNEPSNGSAVVTPERSILYTAGSGFVGMVTISYRVCDASIPKPFCSSTDLLIDVEASVRLRSLILLMLISRLQFQSMCCPTICQVHPHSTRRLFSSCLLRRTVSTLKDLMEQ
jgi:hypothetical protein